MLIGKLSELSGFSRDTIRYYEKIGLITLSAKSRTGSNYRDYPDAVLDTLYTIRNLKELGFTLEEIREIIVRRQIQMLDRSTVCRIIEQKIIHLEVQIDKLQLYRHRLEEARAQVLTGDEDSILPITGVHAMAA